MPPTFTQVAACICISYNRHLDCACQAGRRRGFVWDDSGVWCEGGIFWTEGDLFRGFHILVTWGQVPLGGGGRNGNSQGEFPPFLTRSTDEILDPNRPPKVPPEGGGYRPPPGSLKFSDDLVLGVPGAPPPGRGQRPSKSLQLPQARLSFRSVRGYVWGDSGGSAVGM